MAANPRILVGRFGAPHGVRGEVRLQSFTQDPAGVAGYGPLVAPDGRRFTLTSLRRLKGTMCVVRVAGVSDRAAAEALAQSELFIERSVLPPPDEDEFYVADLVGLAAVGEDGRALGTIVDVPNFGGGDLLEVRHTEERETRLYPFTREVVPNIDFARRCVVVNPPLEVSETDDQASER
jgi:16S rRNA processing protein RimM